MYICAFLVFVVLWIIVLKLQCVWYEDIVSTANSQIYYCIH